MKTAAQRRIRVGVIGCGLVAQAMHLPHLRQLDERFELVGAADVSPRALEACRRRFGVERVTHSWQELLRTPLDAVLVLTAGSHAPIALAAAEAGLHAFVEKPMALSVAEGEEMVAAFERADRRLMVGTMKRFDPAYERALELLEEVGELRLAQTTTLESALAPYVGQHRPRGGGVDPALAEQLEADTERRIAAAVPELDAEGRWCYRHLLLDNLVHELNALAGAVGAVTEVTAASLERRSVGIHLRCGAVPCHVSWADLTETLPYRQALAFFGSELRLYLEFPSPFLANAPTALRLEGSAGAEGSFSRTELVSHDEAFRRELVEFHAAVVDSRPPRTDGADGLRDQPTIEAIARSHARRAPAPVGTVSGAMA